MKELAELTDESTSSDCERALWVNFPRVVFCNLLDAELDQELVRTRCSCEKRMNDTERKLSLCGRRPVSGGREAGAWQQPSPFCFSGRTARRDSRWRLETHRPTHVSTETKMRVCSKVRKTYDQVGLPSPPWLGTGLVRVHAPREEALRLGSFAFFFSLQIRSQSLQPQHPLGAQNQAENAGRRNFTPNHEKALAASPNHHKDPSALTICGRGRITASTLIVVLRTLAFFGASKEHVCSVLCEGAHAYTFVCVITTALS